MPKNRYYNIHTQLEYGKFNAQGQQSIEQYAIAQIERVKHLRPKFSEYEIVSKLSYHFHRDIQLAVYTQSFKTIEQFLKHITPSQNINKSNTSPHNQQTRINYHAYDRSDKARERDDTQNRDNYKRNYTPPTYSVKQNTAMNNACDVEKDQHSE